MTTDHETPTATGTRDRRPARATTVVWGVLLIALGVLAVLGGAGIGVDPVLALVGMLVLAAAGLLLSALRAPRS